MALADTARLVATLELQDKFSATARKFDSTVAGMDARTQRLERIGENIGRGIRSTGQNLFRLGVIGGGIIAANVAAGVRSLQELENVEAQTEAVLASTRQAAGLTADEIRALAEEYESLNATVDDKVIQSGENLLLTFTNIRKDAFEPALQAALDMNQAMGGGEEGLQQTIIRVGKALQDPIRGATALRRVGVNLTEQQEAQIKKLVEQNRLYDAQQLILQELATEFGGSFAKAGETATGKFANFTDAIEDAQQRLASAFLPVLGKVADKLSTLLADPEVQRNIEEFGRGLADGFEDVVEFAGNIPWDTIGQSLKIAGGGARAILTAFTSLPDWVQTAVLTGWGLNKLTGGALGNIAGELGKAAFGSLRGSTPANPVFTREVGLPGGGAGGAPVATGGRGIGGALLGGAAKVIGVAIAAEVGREIGKSAFFDPAVAPAVRFEESQFQRFLNNPKASQDAQIIQHNLENVEGAIHQLIGKEEQGRIIGEALFGDQLHKLDEQRSILQQLLQNATHYASSSANRWSAEQREAYAQLNATTSTASRTQAALSGIRAQEAQTTAATRIVAGKDFSTDVNVSVPVTTQVSINDVIRSVTHASFSSQVPRNTGTGFTP